MTTSFSSSCWDQASLLTIVARLTLSPLIHLTRPNKVKMHIAKAGMLRNTLGLT